jgi:cellulose synthase/poly-beta-1,6-N-acetylglucosamine synthase-like glycosyltransferase
MSKLNVSIILPIRNAERYLDETFHSLLSQTYEKFEVIALDEGSTGDSPKMIKIWAKWDSTIRAWLWSVVTSTSEALLDTIA